MGSIQDSSHLGIVFTLLLTLMALESAEGTGRADRGRRWGGTLSEGDDYAIWVKIIIIF